MQNYLRPVHLLLVEKNGIVMEYCTGGLDLPAVIMYDGTQMWYHRGKLHREGGPAIVKYNKPTGQILYREWWHNGVRHRLDGPAVTGVTGVSDIIETHEWWINGLRHRDGDLPAIIRMDLDDSGN